MKGKKLLPVDPRPSRADPEARRVRKEMEKEHSYEWIPPIVLGLIGITLAWDVAKDVSKCEERKEKGEKERENKDDERKRHKREKDIRRPRKYEDGRYDAAAEGEDDGYGDDDEYPYDESRSARRRSAGAGLERADRLERGEGEGRDRRADEYRKRRSVAYDDHYDYDPKFSREQADGDYDYEYDRRGRTYDDRRSRPRPRRQSSDW